MEVLKFILIALFVGVVLFFGPFVPVYILNVLLVKRWLTGSINGLQGFCLDWV